MGLTLYASSKYRLCIRIYTVLYVCKGTRSRTGRVRYVYICLFVFVEVARPTTGKEKRVYGKTVWTRNTRRTVLAMWE